MQSYLPDDSTNGSTSFDSLDGSGETLGLEGLVTDAVVKVEATQGEMLQVIKFHSCVR